MKTFILFLLTALIATGSILAGLNQHQPLIGYGIGFLIWGLFFLRLSRR